MSDAELDLGLEPLEPAPTLTAAQRLRQRQERDIAAGVHPLTGEPTAPERGTCGSCVHRYLRGHGRKAFAKCDRPGGRPVTNGAATDVLASWPACPKYVARTGAPERR